MFGIGNLFDPMKMAGTSLFGGPKPPSGAAGWGQIPPPGAPPSLLQAGNEDMQPPPMPGGGQTPLTKAGGEGAPPSVLSSLDLGQSRGMAGPDRNMDIPAPGAQAAQFIVPSTGEAIPAGSPKATTPMPGGGGPVESSAALHPPEPAIGAPPSGRVPEATTPMTGITSPSTSPQYTPTAPTPLETGGAGGNIRSPYDAPAAAPAAAPGATPAPVNLPGHGGATGAPGAGGSAMDKLGDIGKAISQGGAGGAKPPISGHGPGPVGAAHTPDGTALMAKILEGQASRMPQIGPVPGLPPGLLERYKR